MAAVRHLGFFKFKFFNFLSVKKAILHHCPNFEKIGQTVAGKSASDLAQLEGPPT